MHSAFRPRVDIVQHPAQIPASINDGNLTLNHPPHTYHTTGKPLAANMMFFAFGNLIYISVLLVNAIAILSEDRFLARVGWSNSVSEPAFGTGNGGDASVKSKLINLMTSVRTLMRIPLILINTVIIVYELFLG